MKRVLTLKVTSISLLVFAIRELWYPMYSAEYPLRLSDRTSQILLYTLQTIPLNDLALKSLFDLVYHEHMKATWLAHPFNAQEGSFFSIWLILKSQQKPFWLPFKFL